MRDELKICPNCRIRLVLYRKDVLEELWTCKSCYMIIHYNTHPGIENILRDKKHFRDKDNDDIFI